MATLSATLRVIDSRSGNVQPVPRRMSRERDSCLLQILNIIARREAVRRLDRKSRLFEFKRMINFLCRNRPHKFILRIIKIEDVGVCDIVFMNYRNHALFVALAKV